MVKEKELQILNLLRNDARMSLTDMSIKTGYPITTIHDTIKRLKDKGVIQKYYSVLDYSKCGCAIRMMISLKIHDKEGFIDFIEKNLCVNNVFKTNNGFLMECLFQDFVELEKFKESIEQIGPLNYNEQILISELKKDMATFT